MANRVWMEPNPADCIMALQLSGVDVVRVSVVLQDCADQLAVLGNIIPERGTDSEMVISEDFNLVLEQQKPAEFNLKAAWDHQVESLLCLDYKAKVQRDREFVARVINELMVELKDKGTFTSLLSVLAEEKRRKAELQEIIIREEEGRLRIKALQKQLIDIHKEKTLELQKRDEMIAHLEDQLQETKVKTRQKKSYVKQSAELLVYQGQKLNAQQESELEEEIQMLKKKLEEERRVHKEMEDFLNKHQKTLQEKLEYWMDRYDRDMNDKQQELNTLKLNKANNVAQLSELTKKYRECEQVITEDRLEKENQQNQQQREQMMRKAATTIQSWWRGTLVRKGLGPFKKLKKPKPKAKPKKQSKRGNK